MEMTVKERIIAYIKRKKTNIYTFERAAGLQFYQARHTFATLSRNLLGIAKSDVDEALNHVGAFSLADVYIKKDFRIINENNAKLLDAVFARAHTQ